MKKRILLPAGLFFLVTAVASAAETPGSAPGSSLQPPPAGKISAAAVMENLSGAQGTAPIAYSIEELYKNGAKLNKRKVVVRGHAVKVTSGIKGKSWTHLQDGTGDKTKGTNDLICISPLSATGRAEVGEVVTITGRVIFNPESRYTLVLEDATVMK